MKNQFSLFEKFFLKLVFKFNFLNRVLFDIEKVFIKKNQIINNNIFITGLPRSGTTILLNAFFSSNLFASTTYRNMPFILCPNIWSFFTKFIKNSNEFERLHNDGLKINLDSPEALEEVFWKVFLKNSYIKKDTIHEHKVSLEILEEYRTFIELVVQSKKKNNYLSKNNNNILRIDDLSRFFEKSKFIIMFRDPLNHSFSLKKQYFNFKSIHKSNKFIIDYMNYLGHFEFGENYKNYSFFNYDKDADFSKLDFWMEKWYQVYSYLLKKKRDNIIFLSYEDLCNKPKESISKILNDKKIISEINFNLFNNMNKNIEYNNLSLKNKTYDLYKSLCKYGF